MASRNSGAEDLRVGMGGEGAADLRGEIGDLGDDRLQGCDQAHDHGAAGLGLQLPGAPGGRGSHPLQQLLGGAPARVAVAGEEAGKALGAETPGVGRAGAALQESERDRGVDVGEDERPGPEGLQLGAQLVGELHPHPDQVLAGAGQRLQRLGLVAVGHERPEAVGVGARQLGQDVGVEAIGLAVGDGEARPRGLDLVGVDRQDLDPGGEQPLDQDPVGPLDRHPGDARPRELGGERGDSLPRRGWRRSARPPALRR